MSDEDTEGEQPPSVEDVLAKIDASPLGPLLRDEQTANRMMFDLLADSESPVVREMGRELKQGNVSVQGLGEVEAYREVVENGFERMAQLDLTEMSQQLDEVIAEQRDAEETPAPAKEEEPEELFQGLWSDKDNGR